MTEPLSPAHRRFGAALRSLREQRSKSLDGLRISNRSRRPYSKGYLSKVELGQIQSPSIEVVHFYAANLNGDLGQLTELWQGLPQAGNGALRGELLGSDSPGYQIISRTKRSVVQDHCWTEYHVAMTVLFTSDSKREPLKVSLRYRADPRSEIFEFVRLAGCTIDHQEGSSTGLLITHLLPSKPDIKVGDLRTIAYSVLIHSSTAMVQSLASHVHYRKAASEQVEVEFLGTSPAQCWQFRDTPITEATEGPRRAEDVLVGSDLFSAHFANLADRESYGIAWRWRDA